jgi:hypothetical protein
MRGFVVRQRGATNEASAIRRDWHHETGDERAHNAQDERKIEVVRHENVFPFFEFQLLLHRPAANQAS